MTNGVLLVPAGRYILTKQLFIKKSNFVLRGEGPGKTILYFPRPLSEVGVGGTNWSFNGGFITANGTDAGAGDRQVTANAARGATEADGLGHRGVKVGDWVRIVQTDKRRQPVPRPVRRHAPGQRRRGRRHRGVPLLLAGDRRRRRQHHPGAPPARSRSTPTGTRRCARSMPTVREVGVENLTLEMAQVRYPGHFNERGYNGIYYRGRPRLAGSAT